PGTARARGADHPPGTVPIPKPGNELARGLGHIVAVSSGKGGVGKSTVAANLAAALAAAGHAVGLLDADIYGPDIPLMFGERRKPRVTGQRGSEKILPLEAHGVKLMSLGFLLDPDQPAIMRGPLVSGILKQFLEQVEWGELDFLVVDMPPGTGDAQLSLVQTIDIDGALMVTTPQEVSTADVRRAIRMFERVNTRILGIVENMGGLECPHCGGHVDVFGEHGGRALAEEMGVPLLGSVPLDPAVRVAGDVGSPTVLASPESPSAQVFREVADGVAEAVAGGVAAGA
ncbi:MAG: Mrp/NBP35 family ATP-binding protein, partial [Longimicrobiales bacterium]